nr:hypothetical protein [Tanacetum cinerariifolium]
EALNACAALARQVEHLEYDKVAQALEITKLKRRLKQLERRNKIKGRMTDVLIVDEEYEKKIEEAMGASDDQVKGRQAEIYKIDITIRPTKTKSKDKGKGIIIEEPKLMKKKKQVKMNEEYARKLHAELNKDIDRGRKGFLGVKTPLFEGMVLVGEIQEQGDAEEQEALNACAALARQVEHLEYDKVAQALEITKLKRRLKQLERRNKVKGRMTDVLMVDKEDEKKIKEAMGSSDDQVKGRQAEIYKIDIDHASKVLS